MDVTRPRGRISLSRLLLLALLTGIAWCALSLMTSTSAASADEGPESSGLLGVVGQTVSGVGEAVGETTAAVDQVVAAVATTVAPAAAPIPAPVAEPAAQVVTAVTQTVDHAAAAVDTSATTVVDSAVATSLRSLTPGSPRRS